MMLGGILVLDLTGEILDVVDLEAYELSTDDVYSVALEVASHRGLDLDGIRWRSPETGNTWSILARWRGDRRYYYLRGVVSGSMVERYLGPSNKPVTLARLQAVEVDALVCCGLSVPARPMARSK